MRDKTSFEKANLILEKNEPLIKGVSREIVEEVILPNIGDSLEGEDANSLDYFEDIIAYYLGANTKHKTKNAIFNDYGVPQSERYDDELKALKDLKATVEKEKAKLEETKAQLDAITSFLDGKIR